MSNTPLEQEIHNIKASCYINLAMHPEVEQSSNTQAYKSQNNCAVCVSIVKKSHFSKNRKYYCKFCYKAVCINCSNLKCFHPILNQAKRICIACFNEAIRKQVKETTKDLISKYIKVAIEESKVNIGEINKFEDKIDFLKEQIFKKKEALAKFSKEIEEINKIPENETGSSEKVEKEDELQKIYAAKVKKLKGIEEILGRQAKDIHNYKEMVANNEIQIFELRKMKENLILAREKKQEDKKEGNIRCLETLRNQITLNMGMVNTLKRDVQNLKEEIKAKARDQSCLIQ